MDVETKEKLQHKDIPEVKRLAEAVRKGVDYMVKQFAMLEDPNSEIDPNDVVKWIEKSFAMAQNVISFYDLINNDDEEVQDNIRGGAKVNKFELPSK